ncbi:MAG: radical SAM protein [Thermodesulfobacteriota bacterium]
MSEDDRTLCPLARAGIEPGACRVKTGVGRAPACRVTLKVEDGVRHRLITAVHLSRPENYLSIYQSGCNLSCRKCHSWYFSQIADGRWYSPQDILEYALAYQSHVTLWEPREKTTAWHAHDSCRCCGACVLEGRRSERCPGVIQPEAVTLSPQGFGPARNIVAFTGGDLCCRPEFYADCARLIKEKTRLWLLLETNGYGLTPENLDLLREAGVDAFWLDIKAFDPQKHRWLTGRSNEHILRLPAEMLDRGFVLEVLSLYIPGLVETDELVRISSLLAAVDPGLPFTVLAFFPEYRMKDHRTPTAEEMVEAYHRMRATGLTRVRLGNTGVFAPTPEDRDYLAARVPKGDF